MARIRTIKPEFFRHEALYEAERESGLPLRVAFAGLWTAADREGRFKWRPRSLKIDALPYDEVDFERVLEVLRAHGHIVRYEAGGVAYGFIPSWSRHQHINLRELPSTLPAPPPEQTTEPEPLPLASDEAGAGTCQNIPARGEGNGREGERKGTEQTLVADATRAPKAGSELEGFEEFWSAYPHPKGDPRKPAAKLWARALTAQTLPERRTHDAALAAYKTDLARRPDREPCQAQTWLVQERWAQWSESAPSSAAAPTEHTRDWADDDAQWSAFKRALTPGDWQTWFAPCRPNGAPHTLLAPSRFTISKIEERYGETLRDLFADFALKLAAT